MLKKILLMAFVMCFSFSETLASEQKISNDDIARKLIEDFHQTIHLYNANNTDKKLNITRIQERDVYNFFVNNNKVEFSITDYLTDRLRINGKLVSWTSVLNLKEKHNNEKKTSFIKYFSINVHAYDEELLDASDINLSAGDTKILVTALSGLTKDLEEIGLTCMFSCKQERRNSNLSKLSNSLNYQLSDCENQKEKQETSAEKARKYKMTDMLYSTYDSEFKNVKSLIETVAKTNNKKANGFFTDFLNHEDKNYNNCPSTIASMTIADNTLRGINDHVALGAAAFGKTSMDIAKVKNDSIRFCIKLQELRNCLADVHGNVSVMNSIRREIKRSTGHDSKPEPQLPSSNVLSK